MQRGLQANTINRRLATVKSMVRMARRLEMCDWTLAEVDSLKVKPYKDTRGVSVEQYGQILSQIDRSTMTGSRDFAMLTLLWENGLRRSEMVGCDVRHFDARLSRLSILGKGREERDWVALMPNSVIAILQWLEQREDYIQMDPLFIALDRANLGKRLSGTSVYRIVRALGQQAGVSEVFSPHKIWHSGVTV